MDRSKQGGSVMAAGKIVGMAVENAQGEHLGKVEDLMIDLATGQVAYAVLSFGGFLGLGHKLFAIPLQAFQVNPADARLLLNVGKDDLRGAPGFDPNHWPDMGDQRWGAEIQAWYDRRATG